MSEQAGPEADIKPTKETYEQLQQAYERLNRDLFGGALPNCLITLQRRKGTYGYFSGDRFARTDGQPTDEIALNPAHFRRPLPEILATLAHEMVHLRQHHFGKPGRGRYHNKEWAGWMKDIGLQPTTSGEAGGGETGDRIIHLIVEGGPFDLAAGKFLARGFAITWTEKPPSDEPPGETGGEDGGETESKSGKRVKYLCPQCDLKAWARHEARLLCGVHMLPMEPAT